MDNVDFKSLLTGKSELEQVIYTHIYIENLIIDFLDKICSQPEYIKDIRLDYFGLVHLSLSLGLSSELKSPLACLGKMRNDFAHKLEQKIDKNRINNFYTSFSSTHREKIYNSAKELGIFGLGEGKSWQSIEPRDKFFICCIGLYYFVRFEVLYITQDNKLKKMDKCFLDNCVTTSA